jgi:hypothetical protein
MIASLSCLLVSPIFFTPACTNDELKPNVGGAFCDSLQATYVDHVKAIIDNSCAYVPCHVTGGKGTGNYETYEGLEVYLKSGSFRNRVFDQMSDPLSGMPPNKAADPDSQKDNLSAEELKIIECWLNDGFPKN